MKGKNKLNDSIVDTIIIILAMLTATFVILTSYYISNIIKDDINSEYPFVVLTILLTIFVIYISFKRGEIK